MPYRMISQRIAADKHVFTLNQHVAGVFILASGEVRLEVPVRMAGRTSKFDIPAPGFVATGARRHDERRQRDDQELQLHRHRDQGQRTALSGQEEHSRPVPYVLLPAQEGGQQACPCEAAFEDACKREKAGEQAQAGERTALYVSSGHQGEQH